MTRASFEFFHCTSSRMMPNRRSRSALSGNSSSAPLSSRGSATSISFLRWVRFTRCLFPSHALLSSTASEWRFLIVIVGIVSHASPGITVLCCGQGLFYVRAVPARGSGPFCVVGAVALRERRAPRPSPWDVAVRGGVADDIEQVASPGRCLVLPRTLCGA